jgi:hypothetical protein
VNATIAYLRTPTTAQLTRTKPLRYDGWKKPDYGLNWRPDSTRRFLVRDSRMSDHPAVTGLERKIITIDDFDGRKLWVFAGDVLNVPRTDAYARSRINSNDYAEVYDYKLEIAMWRPGRGRWQQ